jgi:sugar O-acyltransferase (sialic acid O-acetyltransferase NeuD family)
MSKISKNNKGTGEIFMKRIGILGAGGFAREVFCWATHSGFEVVHFYDGTKIKEDELIIGKKAFKVSNKLQPDIEYVIGVGDPVTKEKILNTVGYEQLSQPIIHPRAAIGEDVNIGLGSIVAPNVIITTNISIDICASLNLGVTIGHDCKIGRFFNAAPSANISGNITIGDFVSIGTNAALREKIKLADKITIGMGATVVRNLLEEGIYIGSPAKLLNKS